MNYCDSIAEKHFKDFTVMASLVLFDVCSLVQATRKNNIFEAKRQFLLNFLIFPGKISMSIPLPQDFVACPQFSF